MLDQQKEQEVIAVQLEEHAADYFSEGYKKVEMDTMGNPVNILTAKRLTHFKDDGSTELTQCEITFLTRMGRHGLFSQRGGFYWLTVIICL